MRFPVDNSLSPKFALGLSRAGHDALHVRDIGLRSAPDARIFERAANEDRVLVTSDTDFGALLASRRTKRPSVILFRLTRERRAHRRLGLLMSNLTAVSSACDDGALVTIEDGRVRVRSLPILERDAKKG